MRRTLATVKKTGQGQPELLPRELISLKAAARILGCGSRPERLAQFGLTPVADCRQQTPQGLLTFRAYDKAQVLAAQARADARDQAERERIRTLVRDQLAKEPVVPAAPAPAPDPTARQTFAILCEIRDLLRRQQKSA